MNKTEKRLRWFQTNPFIVIWRDKNVNSYKDTLDHINSTWKVGVTPIEYEKIAKVIDEYLILLLRHVKYVMKKERREKDKSVLWFIDKFKINETEAIYLKNNINE